MRLVVARLGSAVTLLLLAALFAAAAAQPVGTVPRVGYISPGAASDPARQRRLEAFRQGLRELGACRSNGFDDTATKNAIAHLAQDQRSRSDQYVSYPPNSASEHFSDTLLGYVEGQNVAIEARWAEGRYDRYPTLAADLVRLKVDVIVAWSGAATQAAQQATRTIPIVMSAANDPVGSRLVASLARPGGNVTGTSFMAPDLVGKQLQLLKEVVPEVSRVAFLRHPDNPASAANLREAEAAARVLGVRLQALEARNPEEIDSAFAAMTRERAGALLIHADPLFGTQRKQIAELAAKRRLPAISAGTPDYAEAGGLMAFGPNLLDLERRAATYVDKILKGAKPGDLPVEQPTKFELLINVRSAKAIGLTIPQSLLQRADQIID